MKSSNHSRIRSAGTRKEGTGEPAANPNREQGSRINYRKRKTGKLKGNTTLLGMALLAGLALGAAALFKKQP